MLSPGGSLTGSFDQALSWFSRLLTDHVYPEPDSETWKPNRGFAITLIHGAGVHRPSRRMTTYSRPSCAKPPRPLKNSRSGCEFATSGVRFVGERRRRQATGVASDRWARATCSASVPRRLDRTTRATDWSTSRCDAVTRSVRTM